MRQKRIFNTAVIAASFIFFVYIMSMVPFGSDDWAWGASVGMERLASHFRNYNGRYLGNMLVIFLTENNTVKTVGMAVVSFLPVFLIYKYVGENIFYFLFSLLLILLMPLNVYRQTMGWASGLANYIPPVACELIVLCIIKNVFKDEKPKYPRLVELPVFIIAAAGNLFMEHVTIMNIALSLFIIVYSRIKFKRYYSVHIADLLGNAAGAMLMFSNSAYISVISGKDGYRTLAADKNFLQTVSDNAEKLCIHSSESNAALNVIICALLLLLIINSAVKGSIPGKRIKLALLCLLYDASYTVFTIIMSYKMIDISVWLRFALMVTLAFSLVGAAFALFDKNSAFELTLPVLGAASSSAVLLFVTPVTGRCFYPVYAMLVLYVVILSKKLAFSVRPSKNAARLLAITALLCVSLAGSYYAVNYNRINDFETERTEYVRQSVESGSKTVYLPKYPKKLEMFTEGTTPRLSRWNTIWESRYKDFYNIPQNVKIIPVSYSYYKNVLKNEYH